MLGKREVTSLNGIWDFTFREDIEFSCGDITGVVFEDKIAVPSAFDASPAYNGKRGVGFYKRKISVPTGRKARICFGAVGMYCKVFVDGEKVGENYSAYTPFECELPVSNNRDREIVVMACNRFDYETYPLHEIYFDFYAYGGIFRDVELRVLPDGEPLDWVGVDTVDYKNGVIKVGVESSGRSDLTISVDGAFVKKYEQVDFESGRVEFELKLEDYELWSAELPNLHSLTVDKGNDDMTVRFGIRQVWAEKGQIFVNGKSVKLLGYCRHEAHPQFGPALPLQQLVADLQQLRDLGCNFVRGSHYPQDPRFLDLCDEMGFYVFEESMGWGQRVRHFTDKRFVDAQIAQTEAMIRANYNHPSVIIRGFLNEGESDAEEARHCYQTLINLIREQNPGCLVTYASNRAQRDLFLNEVDVVCFNTYPGWYSSDVDNESPLEEIKDRIHGDLEWLRSQGLEDKPFIISEIGAGAIYGWRDPICAHWSEEYQREYLSIVCEEVVRNDKIVGVALWQFCDCRTYRGAHALGRPRAFNNKGTLDEYRRPKMAYETVKRIFAQKSVAKIGREI